MQNEFKKILNGMNVREDRIRAEEKAIELYKKGNDSLFYVIDLGQQLKTKSLDPKTKTLLRSVIFTISIFYENNKTILGKSSRYNEFIN
ncbi:MAG: hypothetical protein HUK40_14465 [Desulfobacter sp.]|nr:hypothetical protein [Desulfobacter sp.]WDP87668.1 MAG: hypothetical protein HUN05_23135 [Desulfobacter sp.]